MKKFPAPDSPVSLDANSSGAERKVLDVTGDATRPNVWAAPGPSSRPSGFAPAAYYRQGVLVPGGPRLRQDMRGRKK
ncbi:MAG: hypothetical protein ACKVP2_05365 [Burkholderiales bacterium]